MPSASLEESDMFALLPIVALCAAADPAPGYTVYIRELTVPERTLRQKVTGSETVQDAVGSLPRPAIATGMDLWIVRRGEDDKARVLLIDWTGISQRGLTMTNYILLDGDRLFLQARPVE